MNRNELLNAINLKVISENDPHLELSYLAQDEDVRESMTDEQYLAYQEHGDEFAITGPSETVEFLDMEDFVIVDISKGYSPRVNTTMLNLASELIPEVVHWGIGESWLFQVTIPMDATTLEECKTEGSYNE
jgi:hypothetical protein